MKKFFAPTFIIIKLYTHVWKCFIKKFEITLDQFCTAFSTLFPTTNALKKIQRERILLEKGCRRGNYDRLRLRIIFIIMSIFYRIMLFLVLSGHLYFF